MSLNRAVDVLAGAALSPRETQVLGLVADGLTAQAIAAELGCRPGTVRQHIESLKVKLGARNTPQAVDLGHRYGYLNGGQP